MGWERRTHGNILKGRDPSKDLDIVAEIVINMIKETEWNVWL
jgi:hypothetical protein